MPDITARLQGLSLDSDEPAQAATTPSELDDAQPECRRWYRRTRHDFTPVNSRPFPTLQQCQSARAKKKCMFYGFYAGELALEKMIIKLFPEELEGRDPHDMNLFIAAVQFIRQLTGRDDISIHIAIVTQQHRAAIPSIGDEVSKTELILGLFPMEREEYINRPTQEDADMLAEFLETKPLWWEIAEFCNI